MTAARRDGRGPGDLRPVSMQPGFVSTATGSVLIACGETRVICTASVQESVPRWMAGRGRGWVTAEYGMLPASTGDRKARDVTKGRPDGRTVEIQRLIGRSLRGVVDFEALGERTVYVDCDVLTADGGTRCASITGGYVALELALRRLADEGKLASVPLTGSLAAVSCGIVGGIAAARPRLQRGLDRRGRRQRRHDGRGRPRRGAGHGRAHAALACAPRRSAGARPARHRRAARRAGGGRRLGGAHAAGARHPQRPQGARARAHDGRRADRPASGGGDPPAGGRRHVRRERPGQGAGRRGGARPPGDRGRLGRGGGGARRRPGDLLRPLRRPGGHGRRQSRPAARRGARRLGPALRVRDGLRPARRRGADVHGRLRGHARGGGARRGGLRLRPGVPARRRGRRPHDGRALRRGEGRDLPPRPRRPRAARVAPRGEGRA